jgi:hypothetical protein
MGYATGTCLAKQCKGFRRNERDRALIQSSANDNSRELQLTCDEGLAKFNQDLDAIIPQLSSSCRPILQSSRTTDCFDDVRYAAIESFTLWNTDTEW